MALKNYTTDIDVHKTVSEIHIILAKSGAKKIMFDYDDNSKIIAVSFSVETSSGLQAARLPANAARVQAVLQKQRVKNSTPEQAERVAWRIVKDWLSAQMAILETEMVDMAQVFLPYFINRDGVTLYEAFTEGRLVLELPSGDHE